MIQKKIIKCALLVILVGGIVFLIFTKNNYSKIYLWAWERPENFSFLKEYSNTTIVFYAGDIVIKGGKATTNLRRNPLFIPNNVKSFPLVRIDSFDSPSNLVANTDKISDFIIKICGLYKECQLDFEARTSEYDFYLGLMNKIRTILPDKKISVTALASWCSGKSFLDNLATDKAVPMLYRMGKDSSKIKKEAVGKWFLSNLKCGDSIALSVDELDFNPRRYMRGRSVYLFNSNPWTEESYKSTLSHLGI